MSTNTKAAEMLEQVNSAISAVLAGGSDAVILRHPEAVKTIAKMIDALM